MENEMLVLENMGLVGYVAKKYCTSGYEYEDLIQEGTVGLIKAAKAFDAGRGVKFSVFAVRCIDNEILKMLRKENRHKVREISMQTYLKTNTERTRTLEDAMGYWQKEYEKIEKDFFLSECFSALDEWEKRLIWEYFVGEKKQTELADVFHCSQANISRKLKQAVENMREAAGNALPDTGGGERNFRQTD